MNDNDFFSVKEIKDEHIGKRVVAFDEETEMGSEHEFVLAGYSITKHPDYIEMWIEGSDLPWYFEKETGMMKVLSFVEDDSSDCTNGFVSVMMIDPTYVGKTLLLKDEYTEDVEGHKLVLASYDFNPEDDTANEFVRLTAKNSSVDDALYFSKSTGLMKVVSESMESPEVEDILTYLRGELRGAEALLQFRSDTLSESRLQVVLNLESYLAAEKNLETLKNGIDILENKR